MGPNDLGTRGRAESSASGLDDSHGSRNDSVNPLTSPPRRSRVTACLAVAAWLLLGFMLGRSSFVTGEPGVSADLGLLSSTFVALWMTPEIWPSPSRTAILGFRVGALVPAVAVMIIAVLG